MLEWDVNNCTSTENHVQNLHIGKGGGGGGGDEGPNRRNITIWIKKFTGNKLQGEINLAHALAQSGTPLLSTDFAFIAL